MPELKNDNKNVTLFEYMAEALSLEYLSDLYASGRYSEIIDALQNIEEERYPFQQWVELFQYILPNDEDCETISNSGGIKQKILTKLKALL